MLGRSQLQHQDRNFHFRREDAEVPDPEHTTRFDV